METRMSADAVLDRSFLETRGKILEIAANLDRIDRAAGRVNDQRLSQLREALTVLLNDKGGRAERCQRVFSLKYDEGWKAPNSGD